MKITKSLIGLLLVLCVACGKSERETPNGMKFTVLQKGTGVPVKAGEVLLFNFIFKDSKDSVWRTTYESDFPLYMLMPDTTGMSREDGMTQMLRMLTPGDSVTVSMHIKDFFKDIVRSPMPPQFDSTLVFTYIVKAEKAMAKDSFETYQRAFFTKKEKEQVKLDSAAIDNYLASKNITAQKTPSGVRYVITQPGKGENGAPGKLAKVYYAGYTLEGKYFDSNIKTIAQEKGLYHPQREPYGPYDVVIDQSQVIRGWHEALKFLNKGAKATVYIPSALAYGPQRRSDVIKENEVLIFDLEVVDLTDNK
jgi:FKBP-type peptidyl-prolyl cis-trans isomerase FkpA